MQRQGRMEGRGKTAAQERPGGLGKMAEEVEMVALE